MDVPISLGVTLATAMSLYQTARGSEQVYFDAAVTLLFFLLVGRFLDQRMRTRAAGAAANLMGLRGSDGHVIRSDGTTERLGARLLEPGMRILTVAGERFAVDGRVLDGRGEVDESLITGETAPRTVAPGAQIYAGTVNLSGSLVTEATATDQNTLLAEIARLMSAAEQARGRYVRLADRAARFYAPAVHILGARHVPRLALRRAGLGGRADGRHRRADHHLPLRAGAGRAGRAGGRHRPAVRQGRAGQGRRRPRAAGRGRHRRVRQDRHAHAGRAGAGPEPAASATTLSARAASLAAASRHPYARAVVRAAEAAGLRIAPAADVREVAGFGLERTGPDGHRAPRLRRLVRRGGAGRRGRRPCGIAPATAPRWPCTSRTGCGPMRPTSIQRLHEAGFHTELLSGDRPAAVEAAATAIGIGRWTAGVLPAQKIARLDELKAAGRKVLMVGDGLNDAPALAAAHASLSPSTAADISQTAADAVFQGERLAPVLETLAVARAARRMALQNFAIAIGYNLVFVPLAMAGLVTPLLAAIAMSASSIAVTANAVRLKTMRLELAR